MWRICKGTDRPARASHLRREARTSRGQMTHPDTEVLAEFRAGLITGRRGARIAAHLAGCDRCTAFDDQLAGVSALLASVPAPAMPDRVAQRLDTVLAAEVARRDDAERARGDSPARIPRPAPAAARKPRFPAADPARARPRGRRRRAGRGRLRPEPRRPRSSSDRRQLGGQRREPASSPAARPATPTRPHAASSVPAAGITRQFRRRDQPRPTTGGPTLAQQVEAELRAPAPRARRAAAPGRCAAACTG